MIARPAAPLVFAAAALTTAVAVEPVDYVIVNASSIDDPLVEWSGAVEDGAALFASAGCADCHVAPGHEDAPNIGPDLSETGARLTSGEIRLMIVAPEVVAPATEMPAYYRVGVWGEAPEALVGRTRLRADEVEALVVWLSSLDAE